MGIRQSTLPSRARALVYAQRRERVYVGMRSAVTSVRARCRYYSIFHKWDKKKPLKEEEMQWGLYNEFDDLAAEWLEKLSDELQAIKKGLLVKFPQLDLSAVLPIKERVVRHYGTGMQRTSFLQSVPPLRLRTQDYLKNVT